MATLEGLVAKAVARKLASAVLWLRIQTSLENHKWATYAKEWPTHSSPPKKYTNKKSFAPRPGDIFAKKHDNE